MRRQKYGFTGSQFYYHMWELVRNYLSGVHNLSLQFLWDTAADSKPCSPYRGPGVTMRPHLRLPTPELKDCIQSKHWDSGSVLWHLSGLFSWHMPWAVTPQGTTPADQYSSEMWHTATKANLMIWSFQGNFHMVNKWPGKTPCSAQTTDTLKGENQHAKMEPKMIPKEQKWHGKERNKAFVTTAEEEGRFQLSPLRTSD